MRAIYYVFDGTNYINWKFRMEALLDGNDLRHTIENEVDEELERRRTIDSKKKQDLKRKYKIARSILIQNISDSQLDLIRDKKSPKEIWDAIAATTTKIGRENAAKKTLVNQLNMKKKLLLLKYNEAGNIETFFNTFDKTIRDLKTCGVIYEDSEVICHLLLTMPKYFEIVAKKLQSQPPERTTINFVKETIRTELKKLREAREKGVTPKTGGERNRNRNSNHGRNHRRRGASKNDKKNSDDKKSTENAVTNLVNESKLDETNEKSKVEEDEKSEGTEGQKEKSVIDDENEKKKIEVETADAIASADEDE